MKKDELVAFLKEFISQLTVFDYIGYAASFLLFLLFFLLAMAFHKRIGFLIFFFFLSLIVPFAAPFGIKYTMTETIKKSELNITENKKLQFMEAVFASGEIKNLGKINYKECMVTIKFHKKGKNIVYEYINMLKPFRVQSELIKEPLAIGESTKFKILVDDFKYSGEYYTNFEAQCR